MAPNEPKEDRGRPVDRLAPPLDALVERIAGEEPPEEVVRRSIQRVRQQSPKLDKGSLSRPNRRLVIAVALATAVSLACVALTSWVSRNGGDQVQIVEEQIPVETEPPESIPPDSPAVEQHPAAPSPTFWAYHQAAHRSPEALESLLDEHAKTYAFTHPTSTGFEIFVEFNQETL